LLGSVASNRKEITTKCERVVSAYLRMTFVCMCIIIVSVIVFISTCFSALKLLICVVAFWWRFGLSRLRLEMMIILLRVFLQPTWTCVSLMHDWVTRNMVWFWSIKISVNLVCSLYAHPDKVLSQSHLWSK